MNKVKYRAYDKISKQMFGVYSLEFRTDGVWCNLDWVSKVTGLRENWLNPERLILMQFTGLTDKNGKEIYECDIITFPAMLDDDNIGKTQVVWTPGGFIGNGTMLNTLAHANCEVIGNIYENPELLK